jgi:alkylhydroperoxidase/carboxymuconolactone decarboxylase family protein YurZ
MSSKKQPRSLYGNKTERKSGLSRHYREIGIKAVAAATRKESTSPRTRDTMAINRKRNSTKGGHNE